MTSEEINALKTFVTTSSKTTIALLYLLEDLAPVIGYDEAQRLIDLIGEAHKGETE